MKGVNKRKRKNPHKYVTNKKKKGRFRKGRKR